MAGRGCQAQPGLRQSGSLSAACLLVSPQVRYWKTNLELVKSLSAHKEAVRQLSFAPGDLKYATGSDDSTIRVRSVPSRPPSSLATLPAPLSRHPASLRAGACGNSRSCGPPAAQNHMLRSNARTVDFNKISDVLAGLHA